MLRRRQAIPEVDHRHCCFGPKTLVQFGVVKHATADRHGGSNCPFRCAISLMRKWNGDLLLDSLFIVKCFERSCRILTCTIVSNEFDRSVKLRLDRHDVIRNALFTVGLGTQTEALHTSAAFIDDRSKYLLPPSESTSIGPHVSMCRSSNAS